MVLKETWDGAFLWNLYQILRCTGGRRPWLRLFLTAPAGAVRGDAVRTGPTRTQGRLPGGGYSSPPCRGGGWWMQSERRELAGRRRCACLEVLPFLRRDPKRECWRLATAMPAIR